MKYAFLQWDGMKVFSLLNLHMVFRMVGVSLSAVVDYGRLFGHLGSFECWVVFVEVSMSGPIGLME